MNHNILKPIMKNLTIFLSLLFIPFFAIAQNQQNCECVSNKNIALEIDKNIENDDFKTAHKLLKQIAQPTTYICKANFYYLKLKVAFKEEKFENFESNLNSANQILKKLNCNDLKLEVLKLASNYYNITANYVKLLDNDIQLLNIFEQQKNNQGTTNSLLNIASTLNRLNNPKKAIIYTQRAVLLSKKLPDSLAKASILNKISAAYLWYGQDFKSNPHLDSAKYFANYALKIAQIFDAKVQQVGALIRLNAIAQEQKQYQLAIQYLNKATALCNCEADIPKLGSIYADKANLYRLLKKYNEAIVFADSGLYYNKKLNYPPLIANAYHNIYEIEQLRGNYKNALTAYKNEKTITDSLNSNEKNKQVTELEQKYNKVRNEKIISTLSQEKKITNLQFRLLGLVAILIIIVAVLGFFIFRQRALKQKHNLLSAEQRLNRSRINPHFFFNALSSIQGLALNNQGKTLAIQIASFSKIMRQTLESTYAEYVSLKNETDFLKEYLDLQLLNSPEKFIYKFNFEKINNEDLYLIPVMLLQPFIENTIEHGFANINYKGELIVDFKNELNELVICINDNGSGFAPKQKNHVSRATQIINDRLLLLNQEKKSNARFSIDSKTSGTTIILFLPLILNNESFSN